MKILFYLGIACFLIGIYLFGVGYNNVDISFNGISLGMATDINPFGVVKDLTTNYRIGMRSIILSELLNIVGMMLILFDNDRMKDRKD